MYASFYLTVVPEAVMKSLLDGTHGDHMVKIEVLDVAQEAARKLCWEAIFTYNFKRGAFNGKIRGGMGLIQMLDIIISTDEAHRAKEKNQSRTSFGGSVRSKEKNVDKNETLTKEEVDTLKASRFFWNTFEQAGNDTLSYAPFKTMLARAFKMCEVFQADINDQGIGLEKIDDAKIAQMAAVIRPIAQIPEAHRRSTSMSIRPSSSADADKQLEDILEEKEAEAEKSTPVTPRRRVGSSSIRPLFSTDASKETVAMQSPGKKLRIPFSSPSPSPPLSLPSAAGATGVENHDQIDLEDRIDETLRIWEATKTSEEAPGGSEEAPKEPKAGKTNAQDDELKALGGMGKVSGLRAMFK